MKFLQLSAFVVTVSAFGGSVVKTVNSDIATIAGAAPDFLTKHATIHEGDMSVLQAGSNGWSCIPFQPRGKQGDKWSSGHYAMPACLDKNGWTWVEAFMAGKTPKMDQASVWYMLHGDTGEDNTKPGVLDKTEAGDHWIESGPHLMWIPKQAENLDNFPTDFTKGEPYTMFKGSPFAHLMIPMPGYYDYQPASSPNTGSFEEPDTPHTSADWKIWAYSSAAPKELAMGATVVDGTTVLREGTNGWTCTAAQPRGEPEGGYESAHQAMPACFDSVGAQWMQAFMGGVVPEVDRATVVYMLHGDTGEDNTKPGVMSKEEAGDNWIESGPHVMWMPKQASDLDGFPTDFRKGEPYVMFKGSPYAHLMIPVDGYYDYQPSAAP